MFENCAKIHKNKLYSQVRRKPKQSHKEKSEEKEKAEKSKSEEREELDFQFDEELDTPPPTGRHNAFSEWFVSHS